MMYFYDFITGMNILHPLHQKVPSQVSLHVPGDNASLVYWQNEKSEKYDMM